MASSWDLYIDEIKCGGSVKALGVLAFEAGVVEGIYHKLSDAKNRLVGKGKRIGEIHWCDLDGTEVDLAKEWISFFFNGPMMFFALALCEKKEAKIDVVRRIVQALENDPHVPGGLNRGSTTVHLDIDSSDGKFILRSLRRSFGLLRAFSWDSKGSLLLQLSDVLLGIAYADHAKTLENPRSNKATLKHDVLIHARSMARQCAGRRPRPKYPVILITPSNQVSPLLL